MRRLTGARLAVGDEPLQTDRRGGGDREQVGFVFEVAC